MINIGILTSSRADFGVYLPLINRIKEEREMQVSIIAFGTHLSKFHGYTVDEILKQGGIDVKYTLPTLMASDSEEGISTSASICSLKFSSFWAEHKEEFDIVFCLGDRFEMFAAVAAGVPFGIKFAHVCGGDISLGAIDNVYRDCLTMFSIIHFPTTQRCACRVRNLKVSDEIIEPVGLLSLDDILSLDLLSIEQFKQQWDIDLSLPTILITFHPETVEPEKNVDYANVIFESLMELGKKNQLVITLPNADTKGYIFRERFAELQERLPQQVFLIENFGRLSYFSCMKYCSVLLGNSSSGISEAATFNKYAINVGDRQKGRETGKNVFQVPFDAREIIELTTKILINPYFDGENIYQRNGGADIIINTIKNQFEKSYALSSV